MRDRKPKSPWFSICFGGRKSHLTLGTCHKNLPSRLCIIIQLTVPRQQVQQGTALVFKRTGLNLESKLWMSPLQVLFYYVTDKLGHIKGLPGFITACIFAGSLR